MIFQNVNFNNRKKIDHPPNLKLLTLGNLLLINKDHHLIPILKKN